MFLRSPRLLSVSEVLVGEVTHVRDGGTMEVGGRVGIAEAGFQDPLLDVDGPSGDQPRHDDRAEAAEQDQGAPQGSAACPGTWDCG